MTLDIMLSALLFVSTFTGFVVQGIKKLLDEFNRSYRSNTLAACVSVVLSIGVTIGYMILTETAWTEKMAVYLVALVLLSWLCAMLGYDKIIQGIQQWQS